MTYKTDLTENLVPSRIVHPTAWIGHIPFAYFLVENYNPKRIVELGVHSGNSFFAFCDAVKALNLNCICIGVDTFKGDEHAGFYGPEVLKDVSDHIEKTYPGMDVMLSQCTFDAALEIFQDQSIDILHIDGCHTYEETKHNFLSWFPKMSSSGIILFHDIVVDRPGFGVKKFWQELQMIDENYKTNTISFGHSFGLGVFYKTSFMKLTEDQWNKGNVISYFQNLGDRIMNRKNENKLLVAEHPVKLNPKICLAFICRDNQDVIGRMIDSCAPMIDYVIACDTGSKDNTKEVIKDVCNKNHLVCEIYDHEWKNFGHNRTLMMQQAQKYDWFDYIMVMDTDEELIIKPEFNKEDLKIDCIMINTVDTNNVWARDRIFSNRLKWIYKGAAHEFPESDIPASKTLERNLELKIFPKKDNSHIQRNYDLLLQDYKDGNQNDSRTLFYLGESAGDLGKYDEAYDWYVRRSMIDYFPEEQWYSMYKAGHCKEQLRQFGEAELWYMKAFSKRPHRAESLFRLAMMKTRMNDFTAACSWFSIAVNIPFPKEDSLFIEKQIYEFELKFQYAVALYYNGKIEESLKICDEVNALKSIPLPIKNQNLLNIGWAERSLISQGWKEYIVIGPPDQRYDGLGDHLFYSCLARLAKQKGFKKVYYSAQNKYKTPGTEKLVYENNPYYDGKSEHNPTYTGDQFAMDVINGKYKNYGMAFLDLISLSFGLYDHNNYPMSPEIFQPDSFKFSNFEKVTGKTVFDGYNKTYALSEKEVLDWLEKKKVKPDFQIKYKNTNTEISHGNTIQKRIFLKDVEEIEIETPEELACLLGKSGHFICLTTGSAVLSSAIVSSSTSVLTNSQWLKDFGYHCMPRVKYIDINR